MSEHITADIEKNFSEDTYQRARSILPILVRQVMASQKITITYGELGDEINAHHRTQVVPALFCIENILAKLSEHWKEEIPAIQGIVVNKKDLLPGKSVEFLRGQKLPPHIKKKLFKENLTEVCLYPKWLAVLEELRLPMPQRISRKQLQTLVQPTPSSESNAHKQLKNYVAQNPKCVELGKSFAPGKIEHSLPSNDRPDVLFQNKQKCIAVEVKSHISENDDFKRGLLQCVKYRAILEACRSLENGTYEVDAYLAIERTFPEKLYWMKHTLDIKVFENITIKT